MTLRRHLLDILTAQPRTASSLARELRLDRRDIEDDLRHMIRSARAAGHRIAVEPARCKDCGFMFDTTRLTGGRGLVIGPFPPVLYNASSSAQIVRGRGVPTVAVREIAFASEMPGPENFGPFSSNHISGGRLKSPFGLSSDDLRGEML